MGKDLVPNTGNFEGVEAKGIGELMDYESTKEEFVKQVATALNILRTLEKNNHSMMEVSKSIPIICALLFKNFDDEEMEQVYKAIRGTREILKAWLEEG
jgi:hypothetical protein